MTDICIPLAVVQLQPGGRIGTVEVCAVRERLYSNEVLLELILCLADRIEECCASHGTPTPTPTPTSHADTNSHPHATARSDIPGRRDSVL